MQDNTSIGAFGGTLGLAVVQWLTANSLVAWVTIIAGITTIVYNIVKTRKELKK